MTKGSLYYYFPDKQEILSLVLKRGAQDAIDYITQALDAEASPVDRLHQWVDAHIRFICHEMPYSVTLLQTEAILDNPAHEEVEQMLRHYDKMLDRILEDGMAQGLFMRLPVRATRIYIGGFKLGAAMVRRRRRNAPTGRDLMRTKEGRGTLVVCS